MKQRRSSNKRLVIVTATAICAIVLSATWGIKGQNVPSGTTGDQNSAVNAAVASALATVLARGPQPQDEADLEALVSAEFARANPDLALSVMRMDPEFAQAEAVAMDSILHPEKTTAAITNDVVASQLSQEREAALGAHIDEGIASYMASLPQQVSALGDTRDMDEALKADPFWHLMRDEPIRLLAPRMQEGNGQ